MKVGINGMGRIGRLALRAALGAAERPADDPRADQVHDLASAYFGAAAWSMPGREAGFYAAWRGLAAAEAVVAAAGGVEEVPARQQAKASVEDLQFDRRADVLHLLRRRLQPVPRILGAPLPERELRRQPEQGGCLFRTTTFAQGVGGPAQPRVGLGFPVGVGAGRGKFARLQCQRECARCGGVIRQAVEAGQALGVAAGPLQAQFDITLAQGIGRQPAFAQQATDPTYIRVGPNEEVVARKLDLGIGKAVIVNDVDPAKVRDFLQEKLSG